MSTGGSTAKERALTAWARPVDQIGDATTAVLAHGLLGNLAVIRGATSVLVGGDGNDLAPADRARLSAVLDAQFDLMQGVLADLVRGLPAAAIEELDRLRR